MESTKYNATILGIDLGTNSIGWAIMRQLPTNYSLIDCGVDIFQEGVLREKGTECPAVQTRTEKRALRRHYFRRRLRKINLLKVLIANDLCPYISDEQLAEWKQHKVYPLTDEFVAWQRTDDNADKNPYHDRYIALTERLNLDVKENRYTLGRALYHLAQRRGFLSNRKEAAQSEDGVVKEDIKNLSKSIADAGCTYLGEYFYMLYRQKGKIRCTHTSRNEHYLKEFEAICDKQRLSPELRKALHYAIFFQRPLKSQKGLVGKCTFEKHKSRCPISHPRFEEFRMLSFINNIRIQRSDDAEPRPLSKEEREQIYPLFLRKSKPNFDFEDIAKKIAGKGRYACKDDRSQAPVHFNFSASTNVCGCPTTTALINIFGDDYLTEIRSRYTLGANKTEEQVLNDIWHVLFSFEDEDCLYRWAKERLQATDDEAKAFAAIHLLQNYAMLSLNAINKILPYLRAGYRYDEAVFVANLRAVLPAEVWNDEARRHEVEQGVADTVQNFHQNPYDKTSTKERAISDYLHDMGIDDSRTGRLYHPSMIDVYQAAHPDANGIMQLGSPRTSAVRNPMAMRALFRLRILINKLLREGKIDRDTKIRIEFARALNDANMRKAIEAYQREREAENRKYAEEICKQYREATGRDIEPSDDDILKYRLWEEQNHQCLYTVSTIGITDFIGSNPKYDIEHTIPRSRCNDNSQMNKTLCECRFNRETKRDKMPSELHNHAEIMVRIEALGWRDKIDSLNKQIDGQIRQSKGAATKEKKDEAIQRKHLLKMQLDYWRGKLERFTMKDVPDGFTNRQGVDIGIIGKYARLYLKTVFDHIYTVKGATTAEFRKMWGLQDEYAKKERANHVHHCIDAITIACIGAKEYDAWAHYAADEDRYLRHESAKPVFEKPWPTFTEDVKAIADTILVSHHTPDKMPKQARKKLRVRGKIKTDADGKPIYVTGDTARGSLHKETFYGAIMRDDEIKYVVRKSLSELKPDDVDKIVDEVVRKKVRSAIDAVGFKMATSKDYTIYMNEEKGVPIRKVRIYTPSVTSPIKLKKHRDISAKEYKHYMHVVNDGNYCMAIYEGVNTKGKTVRSFEIVSNLKAADYFKASADKEARPDLVPIADGNGNPLKCILKTGTMVLFYENSPEELYECSKKELVKRLYKVTQMSEQVVSGQYHYGVLSLRHHQEARQAKDINTKGGEYKIGEMYRPMICIKHTQFNALVEGYDFELTVTGDIIFKHR